MSHDHYFRSVTGLDRVDVYRLLDLFGVTCPVAQHVVKKAIAAGQRGHKSTQRDWQDIADSAARKLQMLDEDAGLIEDAADSALEEGAVLGLIDQQYGADVVAAALGNRQADDLAGLVGIPMDLEPAVLANAAEFNSGWQEVRDAARMVAELESWPDESRRQDAAAEDEAWKAIKARQPRIDSGPMWVEWRGESEVPPVAEGVMVEVRSRDGVTEIGLAGHFEWMHGVLSYDHDIVAWREPWPEDARIDAIGQNGETGENYTGKPSWNDAPEWAKWLAQNSNGGWHWFNLRPISKADGSGWFLADSSCHLGKIRFAGTGIASPMWRYKLELRPA